MDIPGKKVFGSFTEYNKYIIPMVDNNDVQKILRRYLRRWGGKSILINNPDEVAIHSEVPKLHLISYKLEG